MWEAIKILLFANAIWLAQNPVDFTPGTAKVFPESEISAINSGARIDIDVTDMIPSEEIKDISTARSWVKANIPIGSVTAVLRCLQCNDDVKLAFNGHSSWDGRSMSISLEGSGEIPTGKEFTEVRIRSAVSLRHVRVQWINYRK